MTKKQYAKMVKKDKAKMKNKMEEPVFRILATLPKLKACECDNTHEAAKTVCRFCWDKGKRYKAPKPVTPADIKEFIRQSRQDYGCKDVSVDDVWETGDTQELVEAGRQEGREEVLFELEAFLKRGV